MKHVVRAILLLCLAEIVGGACGRIVSAQAGRREARPSGTYRVQICRAPCDPRMVADIASGTVVLRPETFTLGSIPEPARSYFTELERDLLVIYAENRPNACFVISKGTHKDTYAGSSRVALTRWSPRPDGAFGFPLFQTADATYSTRFTMVGQDLVGRGRSMGPGSTMDALPSDSIYAQRIGPPDLDVCVRAAVSGPGRTRSPGR